jgi:hypothetical protein
VIDQSDIKIYSRFKLFVVRRREVTVNSNARLEIGINDEFEGPDRKVGDL